MRAWFRRLLHIARRSREDADLREEIETHRALRQAQLEREGLDVKQAGLASRRVLGNVTLAREDVREIWIAPWLEGLRQDVRYALHGFMRQPMFSLGAVLVLALGIGLTTTLASFADATFLRPWAVSDPDRVVIVRSRPTTNQQDFRGFSIPEFRFLQEHSRRMSGLLMTSRGGSRALVDRGVMLGDVRPLYVSGSYFQTLQLDMAIGRSFAAEEDDFRSPVAVAVIGSALWEDAFARDPGVVGREVRLGKQTFTIVGVAAAPTFADVASRGYDVAVPLASLLIDVASSIETSARAERPLGSPPSAFTDPRNISPVLMVAGRLADDVSPAEAEEELTRLVGQFRGAAKLPPMRVVLSDTRPVTLTGSKRDAWRVAQLVLLALVLVQLLACANVGNMLLARGLARRREIAIRLSIGAGRPRVVRQLVTEAAVLSTAAGAAALTLPLALPSIIARIGLWEFEPPHIYAPGLPVFWLALGMAILTAIACGVAPALRATRLDLAAVAAERYGQTVGGVRLRRGLLAVQIALAAMLLTAAGVLTRAIDHALSIDPGFALHELQAISVQFPSGTPIARRREVFTHLEDQLARPDLAPVALTDEPPLSDSHYTMLVRHPHERQGPVKLFRCVPVSSRYFEVTGVKLLVGRLPADTAGREIVVSESAARALWGDADPIGKTLLDGGRPEKLTPREVVGVAADVSITTLGETEPAIYSRSERVNATLLVRDLSPSIVNRVSAMVTALEPQARVSSRPLTDNARESLLMARIGSGVAWGIGGLALLLATVGAFGVFAYAVEERRREIGIRIALGARGSQVVRFVVGKTQRTVLLGLVVGLGLGAAMVVPLLGRFLFGLNPLDPVAYVLVAGLLGVSVTVATWIPARRAVRVDPAVMLRCD